MRRGTLYPDLMRLREAAPAYFSVLAIATVFTATSFAQDATPMAKGLSTSKTASTGSTEVATSTYEAPAKVDDENANDTTAAKIAGGALLASGNSRSMATTASATLRLRRGNNQLSAAAAANYATARPAGEKLMRKTVENYQAKSRYDRFIVKQVALFGALSLRKDRFQGLDWRLNLDPGFAYYFIDRKDTQLWSELGYDYQYDVRTREALDNAKGKDPNSDLEPTQGRHSGRLFVGYIGAFNEHVGMNTGVEYLQALAATENWRLVADAGVNATLAGKFSVSTTFTLRYDHNPLPGIEKVDTIESVNLVYTLL